MIYVLNNDEIEIKINSFGAELKSLVDQKTHTEYMWEGNPVYWKRTSPVLFPLVGSLKGGKYSYDGREYFMSQHGFARDMEFQMINRSDDEIWFALLYNEETLLKYPFRFRLEIGYRLEKRTVQVLWKVKNMEDTKMYFCIGGHPAFRCPLYPDEERSSYFIKIEAKDKIISRRIVGDGLVGEILDEYKLDDGLLSVKDDLFDKDALIIENNQIHQVQLLNAKKEPYLTVKFETPLFGIWSPVKADVKEPAPFICIEPWYGRCDSQQSDGKLENREWGNVLEGNSCFEADYTISI